MMPRSQQFLNRVEAVIEFHLADAKFSVVDLSKAMETSESTLRRKVQQYTGLTPNQLIRQRRLFNAKFFLENDVASVSEIANAVGFCSMSYFSKCFQEQFGVPPSLYRSKQPIEKNGHKILSHPAWKT